MLKAPAGVLLSPSRLDSETPFRPRCAVQGPSTASQHSPDFRQRRSEPTVERRVAAKTVSSCVAEPVEASWLARLAGHATARASPRALVAAAQRSRQAVSAIPGRISPAEYAPRDEDAAARDRRGRVAARAAVHPQRLARERGPASAFVASGL